MKVHSLAAVLALALGMVGCGSGNSTGRFLYAVGPGTNSVLGFQVSPKGALTALSNGFSTDAEPVAVVVLPGGQFAYTANFSAGDVSVFARDGKGNLNTAKDPTTSNPIGPITAGTHPISMAINPGGQVLYVLNQGSATTSATISGFKVDNSSGNLVGINGSPFGTPATPTSITVTPNSKFVYVAHPALGQVSGFTIGAAGALTQMAGSPFTVGGAPIFVIADPLAKFLYVADAAGNQILAFTIDANTGALSAISGSPFAAGTKPVALALDSTGVLLLAANQGSNSVSAYSVNSGSGALSPASGSPFTTGSAPVFVTVDASNQFVFVADSGSNDITAFSISSGTLKAVSGSPFNVSESPAWLTSH